MLSAPVPAKLTLISKLEVTFRNSSDRKQALVTFRDPHFVDAAGRDIAGTENLVLGLKAPLVLEFEHRLLAAYLEPSSTDIGSIGLRRYVSTALQLATHLAAEAWQSTEWDPTGLADVEYRAEPQKSQTWSWKKLKYEQVIAAQQRAARANVATNVAPNIVSSGGELTTDEHGIVAVDRHETLEMPLSATESLASVSELHLRRVALVDSASAADFENALKGSQRFAVGTPISVVGTSVADEARVEGRTFPDVLGKLEALEQEKDQPSAARKGPLFHALVGLFRQQRETIALAVQAIRGGTIVRDTLLDALAMASSVEAVEALGKLTFAEELPEAQRVRAAGSLIRASRPGPDALRLALRMIDAPSLRDHGLLGVGSFVRQLREQGDIASANQGTAALAA